MTSVVDGFLHITQEFARKCQMSSRPTNFSPVMEAKRVCPPAQNIAHVTQLAYLLFSVVMDQLVQATRAIFGNQLRSACFLICSWDTGIPQVGSVGPGRGSQIRCV